MARATVDLICSQCGDVFRRPIKELKTIIGHRFCSLGCIRNYIKTLPVSTLYVWEAHQGYVRDAKNTMSVNTSNYVVASVLLGKTFRSEYECFVAEVLRFDFNLHCQYEEWEIKTGPTWCSRMVPDFYVPAYDCFLEVKGSFDVGGKKQFLGAINCMTEDRMLLLSMTYYDMFKNRALEIRKKIWKG